jgi:site-specific recombinase XerD
VDHLSQAGTTVATAPPRAESLPTETAKRRYEMGDVLVDSWRRSLRARARSEATIDAYLADTRHFVDWCELHDTTLTTAGRRDVEGFLAEAREQGRAAATIARRYRSLLQLYKWLDEEDELEGDNPMAKMSPPKVPVQPPPVITDEDMSKLLAACETPRQRPGRPRASNPERATYENKRDKALIMLLCTTGIRAGELMGMAVTDLNLNGDTFSVLGKGGRNRIVALMPKASEAVDKYLRARRKHPKASLPDLWLGDKGKLTDSGLRQLLERRCDDAGIERINPHRFRHTFAHEAKSRGMTDGDLMAIAGWNSPQMLQRYGASAAAERARAAHHRLFGKD